MCCKNRDFSLEMKQSLLRLFLISLTLLLLKYTKCLSGLMFVLCLLVKGTTEILVCNPLRLLTRPIDRLLFFPMF